LCGKSFSLAMARPNGAETDGVRAPSTPVYRQRHRARQVGAAAVSEFSIDALYLSHLGRTTATAAFYGDSLGPQATILRDLHEVNRRGAGRTHEGDIAFRPRCPVIRPRPAAQQRGHDEDE
jgi:broad specificity phosphatase PhoE